MKLGPKPVVHPRSARTSLPNPCRINTCAKWRICFKTKDFNSIRINTSRNSVKSFNPKDLNPFRISTYRNKIRLLKTKDFNSRITASYAIFPRNSTGINTSAKERFFCISAGLLTNIDRPLPCANAHQPHQLQQNQYDPSQIPAYPPVGGYNQRSEPDGLATFDFRNPRSILLRSNVPRTRFSRGLRPEGHSQIVGCAFPGRCGRIASRA
jgi:hypothetical protein